MSIVWYNWNRVERNVKNMVPQSFFCSHFKEEIEGNYWLTKCMTNLSLWSVCRWLNNKKLLLPYNWLYHPIIDCILNIILDGFSGARKIMVYKSMLYIKGKMVF